jgi:NAD(P)-dependent dehydrogenase (short-subunit alcohol dehydrogenase family)
MKDKVVVVTGGAQGIGAAIIRCCAREGGLPVIVDRSESAVLEVQDLLKQEGKKAEAVIVDLTDFPGSCAAVQDAGRRLGRIDALVNNAGVNDGVGLEHGTPAQFAASLERNLVHYYAMAHTTLPFLKESSGSIVNVASKVALTGQGGTSGYAAAKGAILALTAQWAEELSPFGIRVNAVVPAEVMTPQYQQWLKRFENPQDELQKIAAKIPLGHRLTDPDEIAAAVVFLLSPNSSISGQDLYVDGGYVHLDRSLT